MSPNGTFNTVVEIYRDNKKFSEVRANVQADKIYFEDIDIKKSDVVRVMSKGAEYRYNVTEVIPQFKGNIVIYKKAKIVRIED